MATSQSRSPAEVARLGIAIYSQQILPRLGPQHAGHCVAIDVESGEYEIDPKSIVAVTRLLERFPNAEIWEERVGQPALVRFGAYGL